MISCSELTVLCLGIDVAVMGYPPCIGGDRKGSRHMSVSVSDMA